MVFKSDIWKHSPETPLRRAINRAISAELPSVKIYNGGAGKNARYPYIVIGDSKDGQEFDTKTSEGEEIIIAIHMYTEERGYDKLDAINEGVLLALSKMPEKLDANWGIVTQGIDAGSRKWRYAVDKAQKILYIRYRCGYCT